MNRVSALSRRSFLTTAGAASLAAVTPRVRAAAAGANSDVRLLVVGCNRPGELRMGQGTAHIKRVLSGEVKGVRLAGICRAVRFMPPPTSGLFRFSSCSGCCSSTRPCCSFDSPTGCARSGGPRCGLIYSRLTD